MRNGPESPVKVGPFQSHYPSPGLVRWGWGPTDLTTLTPAGPSREKTVLVVVGPSHAQGQSVGVLTVVSPIVITRQCRNWQLDNRFIISIHQQGCWLLVNSGSFTSKHFLQEIDHVHGGTRRSLECRLVTRRFSFEYLR